MKLNPKQEKWLKLADQSSKENVPNGFVYVGHGIEEFGLGFGHSLIPYNKYDKEWMLKDPTYEGSSTSLEYACPVKIWEKKTNLKFMPTKSITLAEINEQAEKARLLIGKEVTEDGSSSTYKIESVEVYIHNPSYAEFKLKDKNSTDVINFTQNNGYCVILSATRPLTGSYFHFPYTDKVKLVKEDEPKETSISLAEIQEKLQKAEKLIGKKVSSGKRENKIFYEVEKVTLIVGKLETLLYSASVIEFLQENGYCIVIDCVNPKRQFPFENITKILENPDVKINGYECELTEDKDVFKFGCAYIGRNQLEAAQKFLKQEYFKDPNQNHKVNRRIESVKIGVGDFTLEDINKILEF